MVTAVYTTPNCKVSSSRGVTHQNPKRTPLSPSEADNGHRKPNTKQVTSRYLSSTSTSKRFPSPIVSPGPATTPLNKRSQSTERKRPVTPLPGNAAKLLVTSTRSLSVSFQGHSFSLPISKVKSTPPVNSLSYGRKCTPERRRGTTPVKDQIENSKHIDQQRWPARSRQLNFFTRSVDFTGDKTKLTGSKLLIDAPIGSDADSISSGSNSSVHVRSRFMQEKAGSPLSKNNGVKMLVPQKLTVANKLCNNDSSVASPRGLSSPLRGAVRSASPNKIVTSSISSTYRGMSSPPRGRNGVASTLRNNLSNKASILSFAVDARRGKVGETRLMEAHQLRLLYNRYLQWRLVNGRADAAMLVQKVRAEKSLYNAWVTTSKLRHAVKSKRIELQLLRQNLKLYSILKGQMLYLENWDLTNRDHSSSLSGAIGALEANTLRLPVVGGVKADIQNVKDSICSAVDVMQAMASSICSLLTKVEHANSLASELARVSTDEHASLDQCKDLMSTLAIMQVKDCSLRAHILQLKRVPSSSLITEV